MEPEDHGEKENRRQDPGDGGERRGQVWSKFGPVGRNHDAAVPVHADECQRPQQDEAADKLQHGYKNV